MAFRIFYVYLMASKRNGTLYTGLIGDLVRGIWEHRTDFLDGFTTRYGVHMLVYYEEHASAEDTIRREKQLKRWNRQWKINLIERANPEWRDLWEDVAQQ